MEPSTCLVTPAEVRLAQRLADGLSVYSTARKLNDSIHTVRTHLKRIYGKTGWHFQTDLVQGIGSMCCL